MNPESHLDVSWVESWLKQMATLKTSEFEMQALIKPYNLPQTSSKSEVK